MRPHCAADGAEWPMCKCAGWEVGSADTWRESLDLEKPPTCSCYKKLACAPCLTVIVDEVDRQQAEKVLWRGVAPDVNIVSKHGSVYGLHWLALGCCGSLMFERLSEKKGEVVGEALLENQKEFRFVPPVKGKLGEIHLTDVDDETVEALLDWTYCRCIPEVGKVLCSILELADSWEVILLQNVAWRWLNERKMSCETLLDLVAHCYKWENTELFDFCVEELACRKAREIFVLECGDKGEIRIENSNMESDIVMQTLSEIASSDATAKVCLKSVWTGLKFVQADPARHAKMVLQTRPTTGVEDGMQIGMCRDNAFPYSDADDFPVLSHSNFGHFFTPKINANTKDNVSGPVKEDPYWETALLETFTYRRTFPFEKIKRFSDAKIESEDGATFFSYKAILLAASSAFSDVFESSSTIKFSMGTETAEPFIKWLHLRDIPDNITLIDMQKMYALAKEWEIWGLVYCLECRCKERKFLELLTADDCVRILGSLVPASSAKQKEKERSQVARRVKQAAGGDDLKTTRLATTTRPPSGTRTKPHRGSLNPNTTAPNQTQAAAESTIDTADDDNEPAGAAAPGKPPSSPTPPEKKEKSHSRKKSSDPAQPPTEAKEEEPKATGGASPPSAPADTTDTKPQVEKAADTKPKVEKAADTKPKVEKAADIKLQVETAADIKPQVENAGDTKLQVENAADATPQTDDEASPADETASTAP